MYGDEDNPYGGAVTVPAYEPPQWRATSVPPVDPELFGHDHWSTFAYIEHCAVETKGRLSPEKMRCDRDRHPLLFRSRSEMFGIPDDGRKYPTRLRGNAELPDHDDWDCADDLLAAGLITVTMPEADLHADRFTDTWGREIRVAWSPIHPSFYTGLDELHLCGHARWGMTSRGRAVFGELRAHKEAGGNLRDFESTSFALIEEINHGSF